MKKAAILLIPIFLTSINGFSQSEGEMANTSQETVFLQRKLATCFDCKLKNPLN